jgi:hypothetical protein
VQIEGKDGILVEGSREDSDGTSRKPARQPPDLGVHHQDRIIPHLGLPLEQCRGAAPTSPVPSSLPQLNDPGLHRVTGNLRHSRALQPVAPPVIAFRKGAPQRRPSG